MGRMMIRPGLRVLPRSDNEVQIGLQPHRAVVLHLDDGVRRALAELAVGALDSTSDPDLVSALSACNAIVNADPVAQPSAYFNLITYGDLPDVGLPETSGNTQLIIGTGDVDRHLVDAFVQLDIAHLLVRFIDGDAVIGPFVLPGKTTCVRCIDAHHTDEDRFWPLLVQTHRTARRADGVCEAPSVDLASWAARWAVHEIAIFDRGGEPVTMGATITICGQTGRVDVVHWAMHRECGCGWSATMKE
ncbi:MAG TPA: hypothetical protein PKK40_03255 [Marmoricola sp.]|nr:hypothetical protein [Marmoricola sp.]